MQKALAEARLLQMLNEEEAGKGRIQALTEEPRSEWREESCPPRREERRNRRQPVCWGCGSEGHVLHNCELWQSFRQKRHRGCSRLTEERRAKKPELNLERRPLGTYVAPAQVLASNVIFQEVTIAEVVVKVLIDSGTTTSCCSRYWYKQNQAEVGPLLKDPIHVISVGNTPIYIEGRTNRLPLQWVRANTSVSLLVIPTLEEVDIILGMDVLQQLGVKIDTRAGTAEPTLVASLIRPQVSWRVPARKSVVFAVTNPFQGRERNGLFEPSEKLPHAIRGMTSLGKGNKIYIWLENTSEDDQVLNPEWEIGTAEIVEEEPDLQRTEIDEVGLPSVPEDLFLKQKRELEALFSEYRAMFAGKGLNLGNTPVIENEIHTRGPPIRQPYQRLNPEVRRQEHEQLKEMLQQEIVRPSCSPWASLAVIVEKKDGTLRFCIDFWKLNDVTVKDAHPLPRIDDILEALKGAKIFSTLDLKSGYWQVPIKEEHKSNTAFRTSSGQLFKFNRLLFGLCNAPATFSRLMGNVLSGLSKEICLYYLDNITVFSRDWEEHLQRLRIGTQSLERSQFGVGTGSVHWAGARLPF